MAAGAGLTARLDRLIDLFNARSLDLPDGLFTRHTQFRLNSVPFEILLGRSADDPLVLMLARGPAGYRFALKAVQHAIPDARLERGEFEEQRTNDACIVKGKCWLSGGFRGTDERAEILVAIELSFRGDVVERADASV